MRTTAALALTIALAALASPSGAQKADTPPPADSLRYTARIPGKARVFHPGDKVPFELSVTNISTADVTLTHFAGWQRTSRRIRLKRGGKEVPVHQDIVRIRGSVTFETLAPGKESALGRLELLLATPASAVADQPWIGDAEPGRYEARIQFPHVAAGADHYESVTFEVREALSRG